MLKTTIIIKYPSNKDDKVMIEVRKLCKQLLKLGVEVKGEAVITEGT